MKLFAGLRSIGKRLKGHNRGEEQDIAAGLVHFLKERFGSVSKAWRRALDPQMVGTLMFSEFMEALARLSWEGDAGALWQVLNSRAEEGNASVGLREIAPEEFAEIEHFRTWTVSAFGGPIDMFNDMYARSGSSMGTVPFEDYMATCSRFGYDGDAETFFQTALDLDGVGSISIIDVNFLEPNGIRRRMTLDPEFALAVEGAKATAQKVRQRAQQRRKAQADVRRAFTQRVKFASGGSFVRGWRKFFIRNASMAITKCDLRMGVRKVAFSGDIAALWKALDADDDGAVHLQEVDHSMAIVLARYKKWATDEYGSCAACLTHFSTLLRKRGLAKWTLEDFSTALSRSDFPDVPGVSRKQAGTMLHEAFDIENTGSFACQDIEFLDKWEPSPYLSEVADEEEKEHFLQILHTRYPNVVVPWRRLFDKNNTNIVSFKEFCDGCSGLPVRNPSGLWCALDDDAGGFISLDEVAPASAKILWSFKGWAEDTFGTLACCFKMLDRTHSGAMTLPWFKRSLLDFGFDGDAKALFSILKPDAASGARDIRLSFEDMKYLVSWELPENDDAASDDEPETASVQNTQSSKQEKAGNRKQLAPLAAKAKVRPQSSLPSLASFDTSQASIQSSFSRINRPEFVYCRNNGELDEHDRTKLLLEKTLPQCKFKLNDCLSKSRSEGALLSPAKMRARTRKKSPYESNVFPGLGPARGGTPMSTCMSGPKRTLVALDADLS